MNNSMTDILSSLLGLDLSKCNDDLVFLVSSLFLFLAVSFLYQLLIMMAGYIGGKRR